MASKAMFGENLRAKAARGGAWLGGGSAAEQVTRFARNMLLTRLLAPGAFGAMAIVLSTSALVGSLSDVGIGPAVIQNPRGGEDSYLNAAWWMGFARAVCIYVMVFGAAPWIAHFYGIANLSILLRVTMFGTILDGMISPRAKLAQKEMKFRRFAAFSNGGAICGVIVTIILSFTLRNVWALAIGFCAENAFRCILSYILCPGLPSLGWDKQAMRDLMMFSKGMLGLSFLNLIFTRADVFVLGKLFSPAQLGIYTMGVYLIQTPSGFLINVLSQTLLPAFSHVQSDNERANRILREVTSWLILLGLPAVAAIWLCGPSLLAITYGPRYAAAAGALAIAAGVAFLNTLNSMITNLFYAAGKPALHLRAVAVSAVVMMILVYPACRYLGLAGGQVAAIIAITASYFLQVARARDLTGLRLLQYGRSFGPAIAVSAGIIVAGIGARWIGVAITPVANIAFATAVCVMAYVLFVPAFVRIRQ